MKKLSKIFAVVLVLALALSMLPMGAAAAATTTKVTDAATIKAGGNYVLVAQYGSDYYAVKNEVTGKPAAVPVTVSGNSVSVTSGNLPVWTVAASGSGISLNDGTNYLAYGSSTSFKTSTSAEAFTLTANSGAFKVTSTAASTRGIAFQWNGGSYRFGAYATSNDGAEEYSFDIMFFKVSGTVADTREDLPTASGAIVDAIFGLQSGEKLSDFYKYEGEITLTGTVSGTTTWYDNSSTGNVNFKVLNSASQEKTMQAYKLGKGTNTTDEDVKNLSTGDKITVKGSVIKNYNGTYEFDGCTLVSVTKGQVTLPALPTDTAEIVDAIYDLEAGESLDAYYEFESFTLSGTVVGDVKWNEQYGDGELTIKVEGTDKELLAYQYKAGTVGEDVAAALAAGDKVTFNVEAAKNYNGTYEMVKPVLTNVVKGSTPSGTTPAGTTAAAGTNPDTGDNTAIVSMTAVMALAVTVLAVLVIGNKKKMF